ncbi:MAG: hypothetical protein IPM01_30330 [Burkholderiaceae bacterium]|nr:hypothetical protein [Burkholderiaceae bacterium]
MTRPLLKHSPAMPAPAGKRISSLAMPPAAQEEKFVAVVIVKEQRAPVGVEQRGRRRHDFHQQRIEVDFGNDRDTDFEQQGLLALLALDPLEQPRILERG